MTNPLIEQFKRDVEEFKKLELFKIASPPSVYSENEKHVWSKGLYFGIDTLLERINPIHIQSLLNLIIKQIEEREKRKKEDTEEIGGLDSHDGGHYIMGFNDALSDTISQLQEFKEYLSEELKK